MFCALNPDNETRAAGNCSEKRPERRSLLFSDMEILILTEPEEELSLSRYSTKLKVRPRKVIQSNCSENVGWIYAVIVPK